jgi:hypothetical protein
MAGVWQRIPDSKACKRERPRAFTGRPKASGMTKQKFLAGCKVVIKERIHHGI